MNLVAASKWIFLVTTLSVIVMPCLGISSKDAGSPVFLNSTQSNLAPNQTIALDSRFHAPEGAELEEILSDFGNYTEKTMHEWLVPGLAVAIVREDEVIYLRCFGNKTMNGTDPVTPSTIFQIGSTTKAFTAALVAMLVDEGKLRWRDRVVDHSPEFQLYDPWVTREFMVKDLMIHNSGLPPFAGDDMATLGYDREEWMHSLRYREPEYSFRSGESYNNALVSWAAELVEEETGKSWEENLHDRIFKPLGMKNSSADMESFLRARDVAGLHRLKDNQVLDMELVSLPADWMYMDWTYIMGPAGGINSNIVDMSKWLRLQMNNGSFEGKQLINESSMRYMHSPHNIASYDPEMYDGLGWMYQEYRPYPLVWHNGGSFGHHSMVAFVPEAKVGIVVLSNSAAGVPEILASWFFDRYFGNPEQDYSSDSMVEAVKLQELMKAGTPKRPEPPEPSLPLERYAGNYSSEIYGQMNLSVESGLLTATMGPRKLQSYLYPWNRDTFCTHIPEFMNKSGFATFRLGSDGEVHSVVMDLFIEGEFGRSAEFQRMMG